MNKYLIIALAAAGMSLASCDEYTLPNPPGQTNPQEPVFNIDNFTVTNAVTGTIDLPALKESDEPVKVLEYTIEDFPESYTLQFVAQFSADDTYATTYDVNCTAEDGVVTIPVAEVQTAFNTLVSKDLVARDLYVRYPVYAVSGTSSVRLGGPDVYYAEEMYNIKPIPQENVIETAYWLVGNFCNWDVAQAIPFTQLNPGNPYDNPDFLCKIDVDATLADSPAGYQWKVVPQSSYANGSLEGAFGAVASTTTAGNLLPAAGEETAGEIRQEGPYMISINMETRRYTVDPAFEYLWVPGMGSSTNDFSRIMRLTTTDFMNYEGTMRLAQRFWITGQPSLKGVSYRPDGDATTSEDGEVSGKMMYDVTSTQTMRVPKIGLYYVKANVITLDWSITPVPVISIIGAYNDWKTETALDLTPNGRYEEWTIKDVALPAGEFKFCVSHAWTLSYGGSFDDIKQNGANLSVDEAGVYDVSLNFAVFPNTCTITKK